jgi:outer membrane receptor protein involved in Fe transport
LNINAKIYGVEFEGAWSPVRNLTFNANVGYLHTAIDYGQSFVDTMNLTQGDPNYTLVKTTGAANCLAPTPAVATWIAAGSAAGFVPAGLSELCTPATLLGTPGSPSSPTQAALQALFGKYYTIANGQYTNPLAHGVPVDLGGHQLPNSPPWTVSLGAQYTVDLPRDWSATLRGDFYWQDNSWARVWNAVNDFLQSYHNVNATLTFNNAHEVEPAVLGQEHVQRPADHRGLPHRRDLGTLPERVHPRPAHLRCPTDQEVVMFQDRRLALGRRR